MSRAKAVIEKRDFVTPDDVKSVIRETLAHRIVLKPEISLDEISTGAIVDEYLEKLSVPK